MDLPGSTGTSCSKSPALSIVQVVTAAAVIILARVDLNVVADGGVLKEIVPMWASIDRRRGKAQTDRPYLIPSGDTAFQRDASDAKHPCQPPREKTSSSIPTLGSWVMY